MQSKILPIDACQLLFENSMDAVLITIPDGMIIAAFAHSYRRHP